ncbi:hypothetical protein PHLCEN_2v8186 [Hermanssonia centrifuga]|uniref:Uncharacterized protein n=1 Tax=Hermanssonia centrifuga TaxID=98765 RepID=A0A2R6NUD0_9APHY|nr:hypothetical protein PHLCEN_2v8186 [Hermanssonia centrifuga]
MPDQDDPGPATLPELRQDCFARFPVHGAIEPQVLDTVARKQSLHKIKHGCPFNQERVTGAQ